jgi:hypothetical protein
VGIHPEESSICSNAYLDESIPIEGGTFGVSIQKGLTSYEGGSLRNISVENFMKSKRSFTTIKVDTIDMVDSEIRIVDF